MLLGIEIFNFFVSDHFKQTNKYFFLLQTIEYLPYYKHKCLDSEPSTFLPVEVHYFQQIW